MTYPTSQPVMTVIENVDQTARIPQESIQITQVITSEIDTARFTLRNIGAMIVDDEGGVSWGPSYHGLCLTDDVAFVRVQGLNLASLYGGAAGDTDYRIDICDSNGYKISGFIAAADAAQALGSELLSNQGFETAGGGGADIWANWTEGVAGNGALANETTIVHGGADACKISSGTTGSLTQVYQDVTVTRGKLYKVSFWTRGSGDGPGRYRIYNVSGADDIHDYTSTGISGTTYTHVGIYVTVPRTCTTLRIALVGSLNTNDNVYFDDVSIKEVVHVGTDGVHIVNQQDGTEQRWYSKDIGFERNDSAYTLSIYRVKLLIHELDEVLIKDAEVSQEDETGASWGKDYHRISLADGAAFIRVQGVPLTTWRGDDGGRTRYRIDLVDSAGKHAKGWLGSLDAALATGSNLLLNNSFVTAGGGGADIWANWTETASDGALADETTIVQDGDGHAAKVTAGASLDTRLSQTVAVTAGKLYRLGIWTRASGWDPGRYRLYDVTNAADITSNLSTGVPGTTYTWVSHYFTAPAGCTSVRVILYCPALNTDVCYFDNIAIREITDGGTDGVHIVSSEGSAVRNWAWIQTGFNRNDSSYTFDVYKGRYYFAGYITRTETQSRGIYLDLGCECQDYTYLLDRTVVHEQYEDTSDVDILSDLFSTYLPAINATTRVESLLAATDLPLETYNRMSLRRVVERLADMGGGDWYVDYGLGDTGEEANLHYFSAETRLADFFIADDPNMTIWFPAEDFHVTRDASDHVNRIQVIGGNYLSDDADYTFSADGTQVILMLPYEFVGPDGYDVPRVYKNTGTDVTPVWTEQTVGLEYVDDPGSYNVLHNKLQKHLVFATAPSLLTLSVKVTARYEIPLRLRFRNEASYARYGIWLEDMIVDDDIVDKTVAKNLANAELSRRDVVDVITCVVREPGLRAGDRIYVINTPADVHGYYTILRIVTRFEGGGKARYELEMTNG